MLISFTSIDPLSGSINFTIISIKVDLPDPDTPAIPKISFFFILRFIFSIFA